MNFFLQAKYFQSSEEKDAHFPHYKMEKMQRMRQLIMFSELSVKHAMRTSVSSVVHNFLPV
jgi:hypothetical protein